MTSSRSGRTYTPDRRAYHYRTRGAIATVWFSISVIVAVMLYWSR